MESKIMNTFFSASQNRVVQLLELLIENDGSFSLKFAIKKIGCKKDTLLKDIIMIEVILIENNLVYLNSEIFEISYYKAMIIKECLEFKMIEEFYQNKFSSLEEFCHANYVSRSTAHRKLSNLKKIARIYNLDIQMNRKKKIIGSEFDIRVFYSEIFSFVYNYFEWSAEKKKLTTISKYVRQIFSLLGQKKNNEEQTRVCFYYLVSFNRIQQNNRVDESIVELFKEIQQFISETEIPIIVEVKKKIGDLLLEEMVKYDIKNELELTLLLTVVFLFKNFKNSSNITNDLFRKLVHVKTEKVLITKKIVEIILKEFNFSLKNNEKVPFFLSIFIFVNKRKVWQTLTSEDLEKSNLSTFKRYDLYMYTKIQALNYLITEDSQLRGYEFSSYTEILKLNALILGTGNKKTLNWNKEVIIFYNSRMGFNHEILIQSKMEKLIMLPIIWASKLAEEVDIILTDKVSLEFQEFREKILLVNVLPTEKDIYNLKARFSLLNKGGE